MTSKIGKRPLRSLSAHEKMDAIRRVHDGESKASVARDIGVPESTLRGWCKNEDKILYLSRQSTPESNEDSEPREKKSRYEAHMVNGVHEPYNLSVKVESSPTADFITSSSVATTAGDSVLNLSKEQQPSPKVNQMSERERNRAELARLSIELGLNRPEMFMPGQMGLTEGLMAQWNQATAQALHALNKTHSKLRHSMPATPSNVQTHHSPKPKLPDNAQSVDDSVWHWLKTQQAMLGLVQSPQQQQSNSHSAIPAAASDPNSSWFWKWYKQFAYSPQQHSQDGTALYQQLSKDAENQVNGTPEKASTGKASTKARAVLDNLLLNNNNYEPSLTVSRPDAKKENAQMTASEALEHGEKFLKWLECFSDPAVTAMQVLQFKYLLGNVRSCADRKNTPEPPKTKVKRK